MKIKSVTANNRKKAFDIETTVGAYSFPYAFLTVQPDAGHAVEEAYPDGELGSEGFTYRLSDGREDTVHLDAVLEYNRDPAYLNELLLHRLTVEAQKALDASALTKRELIRALGTSASQFYRLLDPTNRGKSVGQMLALLHLLGRDVDVVISPRRSRGGRKTGRRRTTRKAAV